MQRVFYIQKLKTIILKILLGDAITLIGWGTQIHVLMEVAQLAKAKFNVNCEVIDLVSILPWDKEAVCKVGIKQPND